jgi:hypothetical protein
MRLLNDQARRLLDAIVRGKSLVTPNITCSIAILYIYGLNHSRCPALTASSTKIYQLYAPMACTCCDLGILISLLSSYERIH